MATRPPDTQFTRTFGAHSTARLWVRLISPALAAPYAAVPGEGRRPLTLVTLTMAPPLSCCLHHAVGRLRHVERREQVEADDRLAEAWRRVGGLRAGRAARVVHGDVEATVLGDDARPRARRPARGRARRSTRNSCPPARRLVAAAHHHGRARLGQPVGDARADALGAAGDERHLAAEVDGDGHRRRGSPTGWPSGARPWSYQDAALHGEPPSVPGMRTCATPSSETVVAAIVAEHGGSTSR